MSTTHDTDDALVESIKSAISMSGLLFQRHPEHDEWDTTRPGARSGEVAVFVRDVPNERKDYLSVVFHREGESVAGVPEDDPYHSEWGSDTYEVIGSYGDGSHVREVATDANDAAELIAKEMERIATE